MNLKHSPLHMAGGYLSPAYTWFWDDISVDQIRLLAEVVSDIREN